MIIEVMQHLQDETRSKYVTVVNVDEKSVSIALFVSGLNADEVPDPLIRVGEAPTIFSRTDRPYLKYEGEFYRFSEITSFSFDATKGDDEVPDFSVIDLASVNDGAIPWRSRLLETAAGKIAHSVRYRELFGQRVLGTLFVPFNEGHTDNCKLRLIDRGGIICNRPFDSVTAEEGDFPSAGTPNWLEDFYHAELALVESTKDASTVSVKLRWNKDGSACEHAANFYLETDCGYLPTRRVSINSQGEGQFSILHLGLSPGDMVKVKVNALHFSRLGSLEFTVPGV